jgi:RNA polymerase sigma-54 factor
VLPDVVVERKSHGFEVRLNNDSLPSLKISSFYEKMLKDSIEKETKDYIKEKLQSSLMLIKNIEQRKNTVLKVAKGIVEEQEEFFLYGKNHIKPMILRDIAEKTGFHESTISRTVNGKYMLTPKGLFEFKYFFSSGVKDCDGDMVSNINIKNELKDIIDKENKKKPLSDQKICDILNLKGINISRRTVAKYREELNIPGSSIRKEI